jgi:hypothetical protein
MTPAASPSWLFLLHCRTTSRIKATASSALVPPVTEQIFDHLPLEQMVWVQLTITLCNISFTPLSGSKQKMKTSGFRYLCVWKHSIKPYLKPQNQETKLFPFILNIRKYTYLKPKGW